ncbi:MAG TPA: prolyl oligopeptidase family serine peptidase [Thermoanaerobaculia bacterium]|nr:prolyl oligopeptidase family serine peptidase [Thermoanaerobaculia bacterium]
MRRILIALLFLLPLTAAAQLKLDVDTIMRGQQLTGYAPREVRWSRDGKSVYFAWKRHDEPIEENEYTTYVVGRDGKGLRKLSEEEAKQAPPVRGDFSRDRSRAVFIDDGDVYLHENGKRRALTRTTESESQPRFTKDEKRVAFVRGNNLFVLSLGDGSTTQLTNIVGADEKGPHVTLFEDENKDRTASQKWVAEEALKLSDVLTRRASEKKEDDAERKKELAVAPLKLKKGESVQDLRLTPDEKYVLAFIGGDPSVGKRPVVPSYVTESGYTVDLPARRKVGDTNPATRMASIAVADGKVTWLKHGLKKPLERTETAEKTEATETKTGTKTETEEERGIELETVFFSDDGAAVLPVRAADNKDRWLMAFDPAAATTRVLHHEHDDAWVHWFDDDAIGFIPGTRTLWFVSEHTGWMQLYTVDYRVDHAGGTPRALTTGKYEVADVRVSEDAKHFVFTASKESLHELHLYRMPVGGGTMTKLTTEPGWHDAELSPDGQVIADVYSYTNKPHELYIAPVGATSASGVRVTTSPAPEFTTYPWLDVPIVYVPARDGAKVPARIYKPANWNGGPAVIFVHGAGYLQNVHRGWSNYFREYMFHHLLMERGYLVLDLDFRASAGYGRDWRTAIYRHMGGVDLNDHVDAAKWLAGEHRVDPKRIGIYGGSYGGFITLMAMFTTPDVFAAGAALRPVTDWAHYNHGYTSNILNTPQSDPEAYRKSSPIYFAEGLKGALLMCHGVIDVNVHFQDSVRLAQRLIELRKENWELAMYPLEDHSFVEPTSWADEYKRILKLFETTLR